VLAIVGGALALGVSVYAWGTLVARGIYPAELPGFNLLRASVRFGVLYALGLAVLAGYGYAALTRGVRPGLRPALAAGVLAVVNFELLCQPPPMRGVPHVPPAYQWLRTAPAGPVIEFPIHENLWSLYWSLFHRQPMVDGYGLVEPPPYARLRDDDDLSPSMVEYIRSYFHARYVVVDRQKYHGDREATLSSNLALDAGVLTRVAAFDDGREVFEIGGPSRGAPVLRAYRPWMVEKAQGVSVEAEVEAAREATTQVLQIWGNGRLLASVPPEAATHGQRVFAPLPDDRADGVNLEILGDYRLTSPGGALGTTGQRAPADIVVEATLRATRLQVNGHIWAGRQGYTMAVIAPDGRVDEVRTFNTSWYEAASHALATRIASIPPGWTAAVATNYDASRALTADAVAALRTLGIVTDLRGRFRVLHAAIGIKGSPPGTALEAVSSDDARCIIGAPRLVPVVVRDVRLY
jgi:interleukin-like EMT inducer protein